MTVEDLSSAIAHHMEWSPHVGSYSEQIAEFLLDEYPVLRSAEPGTEHGNERPRRKPRQLRKRAAPSPVLGESNDCSPRDPGDETASWPA